MPVTIQNVRAICTRPNGFNLVIVRIDTSDPGLYGLGCATFTYRYEAVVNVVETYLKPLLLGRDVSRIEDTWQMLNVNSYWRTGPITNNALSGIDMALWDIKGKMANMPVYELLGGKSREAVPIYRYAEKYDLEELVADVKALMAQDVRYIRIQRGFTPQETRKLAPAGAMDGFYVDPGRYCRETIEMFDYVRRAVGDEVELCHDVHERIPPDKALYLAKQLEPYHPYFLEDLLSPDQGAWYQNIRSQVAVPLAHGELFLNPVEWEPLIKDRMIDFIRIHMSQIGGLTPTRKLAAFSEQFGVRTAWHGPPDGSPIGQAVNLHLDLVVHNLGIQEWPEMSELLYEIFPGAPTIDGGYAYVNDKPGFGIDFDEALAKKYPPQNIKTPWIEMRLPDGTIQHP